MPESVLFAGSSHPKLAAAIAEQAGVSFGKISFSPFPDNEIDLRIGDNVRGRDVFVVQSIAHRPNDYLMELFILLDALKRASARQIVVAMPYFGYARQDRKDRPRGPISAKLIADLLTKAGADHLLTMDLHAGQIQGFFDIPVDNLYGHSVLLDPIKKCGLEGCVVMAPDLGATKLARAYAEALGTDFAVMDKLRHSPDEVEINAIIGDVSGRAVLLVDDLCSTGQTLVQAAEAAKNGGATRIVAACTHGLLVGDAAAALKASSIEKILLTDTIPFDASDIEAVSVAPLFGEAIKRILSGDSLSSLFERPS